MNTWNFKLLVNLCIKQRLDICTLHPLFLINVFLHLDTGSKLMISEVIANKNSFMYSMLLHLHVAVC